MKFENGWQTYRTRFLVRAKPLDSPLTFVDVLGREHSGAAGDYLVETSDGVRRIAPRELFEDVYVLMENIGKKSPRPSESTLSQITGPFEASSASA